ncbi:roadblock/LC7 domain-containing protein [Streptomyces diastaticus]|uniref:roadblock/LC7 domain-containing protein n=1 Tax=Streptomyces diastaticus TaxID=1956 RepID=UPI0033E36B33
MNTARPNLDWMLDELADNPHTRHAVLLSGDGLAMAASSGTNQALKETAAALTSGLQSLSRASWELVSDEPTRWMRTVVEFEGGYLLVVAAGHETYLVISASADVDFAAYSDAIEHLVSRLGDALGVEHRSAERP